MLKALKSLFDEPVAAREPHGSERRHLQLAAASLLHEATRVDLRTHDEERRVAQGALADLFDLDKDASAALLEEGREKARQLTSYYGPISVLKRAWMQPERARFIAQLWRVAYADGALDAYEDHYVRKIAHLLHVSHTEVLRARNEARDAAGVRP